MKKKTLRELVDRLYEIEVTKDKLTVEYNEIVKEITKRQPNLKNEKGFQKVKK